MDGDVCEVDGGLRLVEGLPRRVDGAEDGGGGGGDLLRRRGEADEARGAGFRFGRSSGFQRGRCI